MLTILKRLFADRPLPEPEVGQVWKSKYNGSRELVSRVEIDDYGTVLVTMCRWRSGSDWPGLPEGWGMGNTFYGLKNWRGWIEDTKRELDPDLTLLG